MAAAAGAAPVIPYLGSTISLISKAEIRYEGTLYTIDTKESNIALQNVRSFGTEGRKKTGAQIPATQDVYEYIIFRGADIKDLCVKESAEPAAAPPADPAIVNQPAPASAAPPAPLGCGPYPLQPPPPPPLLSGALDRLARFWVMRAAAVRHSPTASAIRSRTKPRACPMVAVSTSTLTPQLVRSPIGGARPSDWGGCGCACAWPQWSIRTAAALQRRWRLLAFAVGRTPRARPRCALGAGGRRPRRPSAARHAQPVHDAAGRRRVHGGSPAAARGDHPHGATAGPTGQAQGCTGAGETEDSPRPSPSAYATYRPPRCE